MTNEYYAWTTIQTSTIHETEGKNRGGGGAMAGGTEKEAD